MKVFNTFFKIAYKNKFTFLLNLFIFIGIIGLSLKNNPNNGMESFESSKVSIAVIDRDHSVTSQGIYDYLDGIHKLVDIKDSKESFQDELFFRNVSYILIIPENFENDLITGKQVTCENIEVPNSISGIYINMQLEQMMKHLKNYLALDLEPQEALTKALSLVNTSTKVTMEKEESSATSIPKYYYFFALIPFPLLSILIATLGIILLVFNQEDLKMRTLCSAISLKKRNFQLAFASLIISFGVLFFLLLMPLVLYGKEMFSNPLCKYALLNCFAFLTVAMSLGFLAGIISHKAEHVSIYSTSISLFLNFLGGIFVPLYVMPDSVIFFSKFLPTYWYTQAIGCLAENCILEGKNFNTVMYSIGIQFAFAVAIFGVSLVISRKKAQEA